MINKIVVVNNYNYGHYIADAILSILRQTSPVDKILVVDDGSNDDSIRVIENFAKQDSRIVPLLKDNGGQLSALNYAKKFIDDGDLVFLLDSDDVYAANYVEKVLEFYDSSVGLYFCDPLRIAMVESGFAINYLKGKMLAHDIEISVNLARVFRAWIGAPTSGNVILGRFYNKIFPYFDEDSWRTRADDVLIYATSLLGIKKRYIKGIFFGYRIHSSNNYCRVKMSKAVLLKREVAVERLIKYYCDCSCLDSRGRAPLAVEEALLIPNELWDKFFIPKKYKMLLKSFRRRFFDL